MFAYIPLWSTLFCILTKFTENSTSSIMQTFIATFSIVLPNSWAADKVKVCPFSNSFVQNSENEHLSITWSRTFSSNCSQNHNFKPVVINEQQTGSPFSDSLVSSVEKHVSHTVGSILVRHVAIETVYELRTCRLRLHHMQVKPGWSNSRTSLVLPYQQYATVKLSFLLPL